MLRLLERDLHGQRLRDLLSRFRTQELSLAAALPDLQEAAEHTHRETSFRQLADAADARALLARCVELQTECDLLAIELVHVRMAVAGVLEELADHDERRFQATMVSCSTSA